MTTVRELMPVQMAADAAREHARGTVAAAGSLASKSAAEAFREVTRDVISELHRPAREAMAALHAASRAQVSEVMEPFREQAMERFRVLNRAALQVPLSDMEARR
jgi:carboxylesterase type B